MNYTYLLRCADSSLYCGWTNHLTERVKAHNAGKGAKYTKSRRPVALAYYETYGTKEEAMRREAAIKRMTKQEKEALVKAGSKEAAAGADAEAAAKKEGSLRIIVSPAKKMQVRNDEFPWREKPVYIERARELMALLKNYTEPQLKKLFAANDAITHENFLRYQTMDLERNLTPAALAYVGIQYQYMSPQIFSASEWAYVCRHLRILSGFYGILRADDGIVPYRLEMQAKLATERGKDLYAYWGDAIYRELSKGAAGILNLASKEYSKAIEPWLQKEDEYVTCVFGTLKDGAVKVKATEAKMARGEMVRFLAGRQSESLETVKEFNCLGFSFDPKRSEKKQFVFVK